MDYKIVPEIDIVQILENVLWVYPNVIAIYFLLQFCLEKASLFTKYLTKRKLHIMASVRVNIKINLTCKISIEN